MTVLEFPDEQKMSVNMTLIVVTPFAYPKRCHSIRLELYLVMGAVKHQVACHM